MDPTLCHCPASRFTRLVSGRDARLRGVLAAICAAAFTILSCTQPAAPPAAEPKAEASSSRSTTSDDQPIAETASLGDLPNAVAQLETLHENVELALVVDEAERTAPTELESVLERVGQWRASLDGLPLDELGETSRLLGAAERSVALTGAVVATRLRRVEEASRQVAELKERFDTFAALAEQAGVPRVIRLRADASRARLTDLSERLTQRRTEVLVLVDKLAEAEGDVAALKAVTESRVVESRRELSVLAEEPIWRLEISGREAWAVTIGRLVRDAHRARDWFIDNLLVMVLLPVAFFGGTVFLLFRLRAKAVGGGEDDSSRVGSMRLGASSLAAGISLTIAGIVAFSPEAPAFVYDFAWLVAAPASALVVVRMLGPGVARTVWVLAAALALAPLETVVGDLPLAERIVLILQTAPLAVILGLDLYQGRISGRWVAGRAWGVVGGVAWFLVLCLGVATAGSLLGWVGIASILGAGALRTLGGIVLMLACYLALSGVLRNLLVSRPDHRLLMVRAHSGLVARTCLNVLRFVGFLGAAFLSVHAFGLELSLRTLLSEILGATARFGSISISAGGIVGFALVLATSVLLSKLLGFVLAEEVLPRLDVGRGTAYAIAGTTRYLVLLGGFILAAGVTGLDLTTFGFLAGALGVGVGFGLQNIVSNFISGLILFFERPIQVGDTVDVSGATGFVTKIGIRASTVQTFDGAEVVVPNADLISKSVTNWTRLNDNRRFDISVGVAHGSPLEATAQALLVAARRTAGVLPAPGPEAYLVRFGESSLEWALRAWVRVEDSPKVLSDLKRAMSDELVKAGIVVAFPQRDVHIHSVVPEGSR